MNNVKSGGKISEANKFREFKNQVYYAIRCSSAGRPFIHRHRAIKNGCNYHTKVEFHYKKTIAHHQIKETEMESKPSTRNPRDIEGGFFRWKMIHPISATKKKRKEATGWQSSDTNGSPYPWMAIVTRGTRVLRGALSSGTWRNHRTHLAHMAAATKPILISESLM